MRRLVLLRHAKSDYPVGVADIDRPLSRRGETQAPLAGTWVADNAGMLDHVVVSVAQRTRQTWSLVSLRLPGAPPAVFDPRVYEASVADLLDVLADIPESANTVLLIGHNPGLEDLALHLCTNPESEAAGRLREKFPTSAVAVLEFDGAWSDLDAAGAVLADFAVPRD